MYRLLAFVISDILFVIADILFVIADVMFVIADLIRNPVFALTGCRIMSSVLGEHLEQMSWMQRIVQFFIR